VTATEGLAMGIGVQFYPVVDVQNNPRNPIINIRSFGEDPAKVSSLAIAYLKAVQANGMLATAKHFPGHGDVDSDSHLVLPTLDVDRARLDSVELPPFRASIDAGVAAVMSAHIYLPQLETEKDLPATLSKNVMTSLLRDELKFKGLVFSDAMDMGGITTRYDEKEATVRAIEAGNDIVLFPPHVGIAFEAIRDAVASGRLTEARIDESVRRILAAKKQLGLERYKPADVNALTSILGAKEHREIAKRIAEEAITLVRDEKKVLPLKPSPDLSVLHVALLDSRDGWREGPVGNVAAAEMLKRFPRTVNVRVDNLTSATEYEVIRKAADLVDAIVVNVFVRVGSYKGSIDLNPQQLSLLRAFAKSARPFVLVLHGSPFLLQSIPELPSYVLTYDTHNDAERVAIRAITGEIPFKGHLPVSLPGLHPRGHGITTAEP
ncbi:MAG: glycoside hydrolase family 3 N-terminal domain-containing protein, partial [Thermoanaerobaculia bacterium]